MKAKKIDPTRINKLLQVATLHPLTLKFDKDLVKKFKIKAAQNGTTMKAVIEAAIEDYIK